MTRQMPDTLEETRIEHRMWWIDRTINAFAPENGEWVAYRTYRFAAHGGWTVETEPWVIVEIRRGAHA